MQKSDNMTPTMHITSRHKKAVSCAMLLMGALFEGAQVRFLKTKESHYAPKVLRGEEVMWADAPTLSEDFTVFQKYSNYLTTNLHHIIQTAKQVLTPEIKITFDDMKILTPQNFQLKKDTRSNEAAFSNYLAWCLLKRGYTLDVNTVGLKYSKLSSTFFTFNAISNKKFALSTKNSDTHYSFIKMAQNLLYHNDAVTLSIQNFPKELFETSETHTETSSTKQIRSAFVPAPLYSFQVFNSL
ncbi:hypothetical protein EIN_428090 [Entamoeba invadens IP1]|uniref:Uncharacterized protein n=1 Tax=Entamoeba invadens IP1 TaxID=370355 RepID=A0A0A1UF73_ENTIV|nr:hypothetical protein EIN_428090 [Entamoeba invadens IP1]ELP95133.1 hypothetical protein EIN_428090 [Entamoeba invadens IP1]|eukprot:XP_004261904.1 hypothetical protein EIN_428090 [Entamoeba invadens IP1]